MVICLERDADLHMAQLMPLPLTVSCFSKIQIGFTFLVPAHPGSPGQRAVKRMCVCVCVCVCVIREQPDRHQFVVFITFGSMQMASVTEVIEHSEIMCSFYACLPHSRRK